MEGNFDVANRIKELRRNYGISQKKFSEILAVSKSTVGLWETGETLPNAECLYNISLLFDVSSDWLIGLTDKKQKETSVFEYTGLTKDSVDAIRNMDDKDRYCLNEFLQACLGVEKQCS